MMCVSVYIIHSGFTFFTTYLILAHHSETISLKQESFNLLFDVIFTMMFFLMIIYSSSMTDEAKSMANLIHTASNLQSDVVMVDKINFLSFSQQIIHRYPVASCGLFSFDWSLVYSIAAALCSYLIILIQFDNPNVLKSN